MRKQHILVIDDSPDVHELVKIWLAEEPIDILTVREGEQALALAVETRPDLVLLDDELTGFSAFEICRRLKADLRTAETPVVFLTSASSTEQKLLGLELGAADYIVKPFGPAELRARVRTALHTKRLMDMLSFQAMHDALTQLPNRALFQDRLEQALALARRTGRPAAVMLIDIDRFKYINDTFGHQTGDEMLRQVAQRLQQRLRSSDTLARMGGDEFAVILTSISNVDDAEQVAASLVSAFQQPIELPERRLFVTVSIGSAVFPRDGNDPMSLLKNADLALYQAKDAGRNTARAFAPGMGEVAAERMRIETALREAVDNRQLRLFYQPKVDPAGNIIGLEALVRWQHPTLGLVPPTKFIPLAEDTGLIVPIGRWVLEEAARQQREWSDRGLQIVPIAVNVSAIQFAQTDFVDSIAEVLERGPRDKHWLEIELTESLLMRNVRDAADKIAQLRAMNVAVAIDDFGTGYSSLAYLQRLRIDTLKIDRSFVNEIDKCLIGDPHKRADGSAIITAIVAMARSLSLHVVAEGVETETQREHLLTLGCTALQGFLFSPPLPAEQVEQSLHRQVLEAVPIAA